MKTATSMKCICCPSGEMCAYGPVLRCAECGYAASTQRFQNPYEADYGLSRKFMVLDLTVESVELAITRVGFLKAMSIDAGEVFDVGCSVGSFLHRARKDGFSVTGCDISPFVWDDMQRKAINFRQENFEEAASLPDVNVTAVTMFDVIEHFKDPEFAVKKAREMLRTGGAIVISTPNAEGLGPIEIREWRHYRPEEHFHYFTAKALTGLLKRLGFRDFKVSYAESSIRADHERPGLNILTVSARKVA